MHRNLYSDLVEYDPEPERSLHRRRKLLFPSSSESSSDHDTASVSSEEVEDDILPPPAPMPKLSDDGLPKANQVPTGTFTHSITATNFKIDAGFYNLVHKDQFGGEHTEDPASHINHFCDLCQLITHEGVTPEQLKYLMFPHSLKGKAYSWLQTLKGVGDWDTLVLTFYQKFFPPERTAMLRSQITSFRQRLSESLYDAWERFKLLEKQCPHHGFSKGFIAMTFYNALTPDSKRTLDSAANGRFDSVEVDAAWDVIESMATHSINYGQSMYTSVSAVNSDTLFQHSMASQIEELKAQLASLKVESSSSSQVQHLAAVSQPITPIVAAHCDSCGIYGHLPYSCQGTQEQVAAFQAYRNNQPYYSNYNSSYNQPYQHFNNPPPVAPIPAATPPPYVHPNKAVAESSKPHVSELQELRNLVRGMVKSQEHLVSHVTKTDQERASTIKNIETQIAQLAASQAARQPGHLPSQPTNPNNVHHAYAISLNKSDVGTPAGKDISKGKQQGSGSGIEIKVPFPGRLNRKSDYEVQFGKFKEVLSKLNITIPFLDLVLQVPSYIKFLKSLLNRKHSLAKVESVAFTEECGALRQGNPLPKLSDPGSFSIPCEVGTLAIEKALCDLGASVSVLPLSLAKKMGMTQFTATNMTIQMADRSITRPLGILEDIPVKVGAYFIPVDFIVLDIPEDSNIPVILGRPFLHTTGALIDVGKRTLTVKVGGDEIVFKQSGVPRAPMRIETDPAINVKEAPVVPVCAINVLSPPHDTGGPVEIFPSISGTKQLGFAEVRAEDARDTTGRIVTRFVSRFGESDRGRPKPFPNDVFKLEFQRDELCHKIRSAATVDGIVDIDPGPPWSYR